MPELPEVEVTCRALAARVQDTHVTQVQVRNRKLRWPVPKQLAHTLNGHAVQALSRRGKYLLWHFEHGVLLCHLGMSGTWRVYTHECPPGPHDHLDIVVAHQGVNTIVRYHDPRRFGAILWHATRSGDVAQHPLLARLGLEPFDPRFDGAYLFSHTRQRAISIKQLLLSGHVVVGVGNIYASECLFAAGIAPNLAAQRLSAARCARLAQAIRTILAKAIEAGGSSLRDFVHTQGENGAYTQHAQVYGRMQQPCPICATSIRKIVQNQRATYYCPRCQRR